MGCLSAFIHAAHEPDVSFSHAVYNSLFGCMDYCCDRITDNRRGVRRFLYIASMTVPTLLPGILPKF